MASTQGTSQTGTRDETYNLVSMLYHALQGAENCQIYSQDAGGDPELRGLFDEARDQQRQLADRAKQLLQSRLGRECGQGGGGAFGFARAAREANHQATSPRSHSSRKNLHQG